MPAAIRDMRIRPRATRDLRAGILRADDTTGTGNMDKKQAFSMWYAVVAMVLMILLQEFGNTRHTVTLSYSEFKQAVLARKVDDIVISDGLATGKLAGEGLEQVLPRETVEALKRGGGDQHRFTTVLVDDPQLVAQLARARSLRAGGAAKAPCIVFSAERCLRAAR